MMARSDQRQVKRPHRAQRTKRDAVKRKRGRWILLGVIAVAIAGLAAWWSLDSTLDTDPTTPIVLADVVQVGSAAGFNVLLITLDTTRRDYLGCYGDEESSTPAIDSLPQHGVRIDDAVVSAPITNRPSPRGGEANDV